jgi:hypothetical protein
MVSSLASSAVDRGLNPRSSQTIDYIQLVYVAFPLSTQHEGERTKNGWLGIRIMWPSEATCLLANLFQWTSNLKIQLSVLVQYNTDICYHLIECIVFSPWYILKIAHFSVKQQPFTHSFRYFLTKKICRFLFYVIYSLISVVIK